MGDLQKNNTSLSMHGLKKETHRLIYRCHKKISKVKYRHIMAVEKIVLVLDPETSLDELSNENVPHNVDELEKSIKLLQIRLDKLKELEEGLKSCTTKELPSSLKELVVELDVNDYSPKKEFSVKIIKKK